MFIDFKTLIRVVPLPLRARHPIMLRAPHGVGKSEFVRAFAPKIASILYPNANDRKKAYGKADYVYPIVERRASQMADAGDLMGLPYQDGPATEFKPMKWFHMACEQPCILFVDEIDRGNQDVRQAFFELADSRKIANHTLHKDTVIFACVNGSAGGNTTYQVGDMDPAEVDRWTIYDVKPTPEDWLDWAKDKVAPQIWDFIKQNKSSLEHNAEFEPNKVYPSRRSWIRFNDAMKGTSYMDDAIDDKDSSLVLYHAADGYLGQETAILFQEFCKNFKKQVTVEDVILKGDFKHAFKLEINQHMALIDKFGDHEFFKTEMDQNIADNLGKYLLLVPPELAMKIWETTTRLFPKNGVILHGTVVDFNGKKNSISQYLAALNGAGQTDSKDNNSNKEEEE